MKHSFSFSLCLVFFFAFQTADAQQYRMPRWGLRFGLDGLLTNEHNQGVSGLLMTGPMVDFQLADDGMAAMKASSGLLLLHSDAAAIGLPLELQLGVHGKNLGLFFGGGFIFQRGEALFDEKSTVPTLSLNLHLMAPNRPFYCTFYIRTVRLPHYEYFNSQWTRYPTGGGGAGLGLSFGGYIGKWREPKPSDN